MKTAQSDNIAVIVETLKTANIERYVNTVTTSASMATEQLV